jgi:polyphenol oxidase
MPLRSPKRKTLAPSSRAPRAAKAAAWKTLRSRGLQILQTSLLTSEPWLSHGFSTRIGGSSPLGKDTRVLNLGFTDWDSRENVESNRAKFTRALGSDTWQLVTLRQIHSDVVHVHDAVSAVPLSGDAVITSTPGLLLAVQTADCVPILLADTRRRVVAAVHAGWRGTLARIVAKTVGRMRMSFGTVPRDIVAALGPSIGQCSYEVGPEVAQAFAAQFAEARAWFDGPFDALATGEEPNPLKWLTMVPPGHDPPPPRVQLDLIAANRWQLEDAGVPAAQIIFSDLCTACRTDLLFSYRRENGRTGRMMSVIGIRKS